MNARLSLVLALLLITVPLMRTTSAQIGTTGRGAAAFDSAYPLPPLRIGATIEATFGALRVPPHLAEPCFLDRQDMTVSCRLGASRLYQRGERNLPADALPLPIDSLELQVISEGRLVIGYRVYQSAPDTAFDRATRAMRETLRRTWGSPADSIGPCLFWGAGRAASRHVWSASYCLDAAKRRTYISVTPVAADAARAQLRTRGTRLPLALKPWDLPSSDSPWWVPLWRPLALGELEPGRDAALVAAAAGVPMNAARCSRSDPWITRDTLRLDCEWVGPRVVIAKQRPTTLKLALISDPEHRHTRADDITLTFGTFSRPKWKVLEQCREIAAVLRESWGLPTKESSGVDDCEFEWHRPPFSASLGPVWDDALPGNDVWALWLHLDVQPQAVPPEFWQR